MASFIMALIVTHMILATFPPRGVGCLMALIMGLYLEICVHLRERCGSGLPPVLQCTGAVASVTRVQFWPRVRIAAAPVHWSTRAKPFPERCMDSIDPMF
jgi:hypothetical protein